MAKADMFLKVKGQKYGPITGDSKDSDHKDEIEVLAWSWGIKAGDITGIARSGKRSFLELQIHKRVDPATTQLYQSAATNEVIVEAKLTCRRVSGDGKPVNYLVITINDAKVKSVTTRSGEPDTPSHLLEQVSFVFRKVDISYPPANRSFSDEWESGS